MVVLRSLGSTVIRATVNTVFAWFFLATLQLYCIVVGICKPIYALGNWMMLIIIILLLCIQFARFTQIQYDI